MQTFTDPAKKENYFLSQPHQPFFLSAIVWAMVSMLIFGIAYKLQLKGSVFLSVDSTMFHMYSLIFIVMTEVFIGFLYTTFPKFCQTEVVSKAYYLLTFGLFQVGSLLFMMGSFVSIKVVILAMMILFLGLATFLYRLLAIYRASTSSMKQDQLWILIALAIGFISSILSIVQLYLEVDLYAYKIAFILYVTFLTFSVAQRMVPFFSHSQAEKPPYLLALVFGLLVAKVLANITDYIYIATFVDLILSVLLFREFLRWKLNFKMAPAILKILHVALFWLPIGLFLGAVVDMVGFFTEMSFVFAQTHLIALGFIITMLIGFGTRVTLGHSGQPPHADRTTLWIFYMTQALVIARLLFSLGFDAGLFWLFDLSLLLWLMLFGFWMWKFSPILVRGKK